MNPGQAPRRAELPPAEESTPLIDVAHRPPPPGSMLTSHDVDYAAIFACLLIGQRPASQDQARRPHLYQRIAVRLYTTGMTLEATASYLNHRLQPAHRSDTRFPDDAALIHLTNRGSPRAISNLATWPHVAVFAVGKAIIDQTSAHAAMTEVTTA